MKSKMLITILLLHVMVAKSQNIGLIELISRTECKTYECFNNYVLDSFSLITKNDSDPNYHLYVYRADALESNSQSGFKRIIGIEFKKQQDKDGSYNRTIVSLTTRDKQYYLSFLRQLKELGFTSYKTDNSYEQNGVTIKYESQQFPSVYVGMSQYQRKSGSSAYSEYTIQINRFN